MRKTIATLIIALFVLSLALTGCTKEVKVYVCSDGREMPTKDACGINKVAGVNKMESEKYARNYVTAYFVPYGGKAQLISSYLNSTEGDYYATFIVADKTGSPYETEVKVDGVTGKVTCQKKCDYTQ